MVLFYIPFESILCQILLKTKNKNSSLTIIWVGLGQNVSLAFFKGFIVKRMATRCLSEWCSSHLLRSV